MPGPFRTPGWRAPTRKGSRVVRLEALIHLIQLVDQEYARLLVLKGAHERAGAKEVAALKTGLKLLPATRLSLEYSMYSRCRLSSNWPMA